MEVARGACRSTYRRRSCMAVSHACPTRASTSVLAFMLLNPLLLYNIYQWARSDELLTERFFAALAAEYTGANGSWRY